MRLVERGTLLSGCYFCSKLDRAHDQQRDLCNIIWKLSYVLALWCFILPSFMFAGWGILKPWNGSRSPLSLTLVVEATPSPWVKRFPLPILLIVSFKILLNLYLIETEIFVEDWSPTLGIRRFGWVDTSRGVYRSRRHLLERFPVLACYFEGSIAWFHNVRRYCLKQGSWIDLFISPQISSSWSRTLSRILHTYGQSILCQSSIHVSWFEEVLKEWIPPRCEITSLRVCRRSIPIRSYSRLWVIWDF